MTMQLYYILQLAGIFCAYFFTTIVLPFIAFHKKMKGQRILRKILFCYLVGNFYVINLVFALELLHISNRFTLILFTFVPFFLYANRANQWHIRRILWDSFKNLQKLMGKRIGIKTLLSRGKERICHQLGVVRAYRNSLSRLAKIDILLGILTFGLVIVYYGISVVRVYGYAISDLPVHNYWINALSENQLFVAGIYPEGAHCMDYYLHMVFGFDTYMILSTFGFVQVTCIIYCALFLMKLCCKNRFAPYMAIVVYVCMNTWSNSTYHRFYSALPQEFGMIFIMPALYFGFEFFRLKYQEYQEQNGGKFKKKSKKKKVAKAASEAEKVEASEEVREAEEAVSKSATERLESSKTEDESSKTLKAAGEEKAAKEISQKESHPTEILDKKTRRKQKRQARWERIKAYVAKPYFSSLCGFCMSFSLTFMAHFYDTMALGVCCVAMALAYFGLFIRKDYFWKIVVTCSIGLAIAMFPMVVMYLAGTPLQGSLNWGLNIISDSTKTEEDTDSEVMSDSMYYTLEEQNESLNLEAMTESTEYAMNGQGASGASTQPSRLTLLKNKLLFILQRIQAKNSLIKANAKECLFANVFGSYYDYTLIVIGILLLLGLIFHLLHDRLYGSMLWTMALSICFLLIMMSAGSLGLPKLMDSGRASIYTAYVIITAFAFAIDGVLTLPSKLAPEVLTVLFDCLTLLGVAFLLVWIYSHGQGRKIKSLDYLETNEAVTCLTNIIRTQEDDTWTIISANDENQMGADHGYHYETLSLLQEIDVLNEDTAPIYIPTEKIFVFIEKNPLTYLGDGSGSPVSEYYVKEDYARLPLPGAYLQLYAYKEENRLICMSRLYYYMQAFKEIYPESVQVYYEDDKFVCYEITQNTYRRYNLAIDYGYNIVNY